MQRRYGFLPAEPQTINPVKTVSPTRDKIVLKSSFPWAVLNQVWLKSFRFSVMPVFFLCISLDNLSQMTVKTQTGNMVLLTELHQVIHMKLTVKPHIISELHFPKITQKSVCRNSSH